MGTQKQKKLARNLVENLQRRKPKTGGEIVLDAGYSLEKSKAPGRVIDAPGVKEELEILGFSEEKAKEVVGQILTDSEKDASSRLRAADMVFKVHGTYVKEQESQQGNTINFFFNDSMREKAQMFEQEMKNLIINGDAKKD